VIGLEKMKLPTARISFAVAALMIMGLGVQHSLYAQAIDPNGVPDDLRSCLHSHPGLQFDGGINPYYIAGDFDGDGVTDFAVLVRGPNDKGAGIHHILFCFGQGKTVLWDARTLAGSISSPFTTWFLVRKQSKLLSVHPKITHDSLAILIGEEGGGLIYWDGHKLAWQQEE
jgi:hypothetical protein